MAFDLEKEPHIAVCPVNHTGDKHSPAAWKMSNAIPGWSWNGCAGKQANVEVYARAAKVELFVNGKSVGVKERLNKSKRTDWRADFSPDEGEKSQEYFVYFKILSQNMAENMPSRWVRRFVQRFLKEMKNDCVARFKCAYQDGMPFPPGCYWSDGKFTRYCDIAAVEGGYVTGELDVVCGKIRELLIAGIKKRLDADAPLGFLLSGGLDSSLVCAVAAKLLGKQIRTFAIGMDKDAIDLKYARQAAGFIGSDHTEVYMTRQQVLDSLR